MLAAPLVAHAYAGTSARYVGDDYCAGYIFRDEGLIGGQRWFYFNWGAVPTVLALMALTEPGGPRLAPWLPALALVAWVGTGAWSIRWITAAAGDRWGVAVALLAAEALIFATLHDTPNVIQSLYLRVPMLAYTGPLIALSLYAGVVARATARRSAARTTLAVTAVLAFLGGSFGPGFVAMQTASLVIAAAANLALNRSDSRGVLHRLLVAGLAGSLAALAFVALAPGNSVRQGSLPGPPSPLNAVKWSVLSASFMFIRPVLPIVRPGIEALVPRLWGQPPDWLGKALEMTASPLTMVLIVAVGAAIALRSTDRVHPIARHADAALVAAPVVAFVLVLAAMMPGAYGTSAPPPPRALVIPQCAIACLTMAWGYALGVRLSASGARRRITMAAAAVASCLIVGLSIVSVRATLSRAQTLRAWAAEWDAVDGALRAAHDAGQREAVVAAIGTIGGVGTIATDPDDWVNACAARYYGLDRITGVVRR